MKEIHKTALVPYSAENMFHLVNRITDYPKFLPWCEHAEVLNISDDGSQITAKIKMGSLAMGKSFTTRNLVKIGEKIEMNLVDGPFSELNGVWDFKNLGDNVGCKISLEMRFEIANPILRKGLSPIFNRIVNSLMDAFIERAHECYGN